MWLFSGPALSDPVGSPEALKTQAASAMPRQSLTTAAIATGLLFLANGGDFSSRDQAAAGPVVTGASAPVATNPLSGDDLPRLAGIPAPSGAVVISLISLMLLLGRGIRCPVMRIVR